MKKKFDRVYQFKITLKGIRPPIWRRIQVPETYTFWDLHIAIQNAMGWTDAHLHEFEMVSPSTGEKVRIGNHSEEDEVFGQQIIPEEKQKIAKWFSMENKTANYIYDFGDGWEHKIELEKILPRDKNVKYPVCIAGKRACPPEDCGGVWGYEEFLEAIRNPEHEEHSTMLEWVGGEFDPEYFDPKEVLFEDPDECRKYSWSNNNMDNDKEETRDFIKEAEELLVDAENDLNRGDYKSCFSKSYHAMVFSLKALLSLLEKRQEKAEVEKLSREVENKFEDMYNQILLIDHATGLVFSEKEVREFFKVAGDFVQDLKNRIKTFSFSA